MRRGEGVRLIENIDALMISEKTFDEIVTVGNYFLHGFTTPYNVIAVQIKGEFGCIFEMIFLLTF